RYNRCKPAADAQQQQHLQQRTTDQQKCFANAQPPTYASNRRCGGDQARAPLQATPASRLLVLLSFIIRNVEVSELVDVPVLVRGNNAQPVAHVVLLQVLLGEVLEVPLAEVRLRSDSHFGLVLSHFNGVAKYTSLAVHLDLIKQKFLKGRNVHNLILHRLSAVDGKDQGLLLRRALGGRLLNTHGHD
ncbi:hypothetical protein Vretimale_9978, partial [Volvox reticuliferus]